jgi:hypothetical protein
MKIKQAFAGVALVVVLAATAAVANAQETSAPTPQPAVSAEPSASATPEIFPTPTNFVCAVISNSRAQLTRTREQWENECYSNPFTDEEMAHEPNAADLTHPGYDASPEAWSDWYGARVESCKVLTKDAEYIECMYRPWVYGF